MKVRKCGAADSKYFGNLDRFEDDIKKKQEEHNRARQTVRDLILQEPSKMDLRYRDVLEELKELKTEFNING